MTLHYYNSLSTACWSCFNIIINIIPRGRHVYEGLSSTHRDCEGLYGNTRNASRQPLSLPLLLHTSPSSQSIALSYSSPFYTFSRLLHSSPFSRSVELSSSSSSTHFAFFPINSTILFLLFYTLSLLTLQ